MKLTLGVTDLSEETLQFAAQFGVTHLKVNAGDFMDERQRGPVQRHKLLAAKQQIEAHGLQIGVALLPQGAGTQHWNMTSEVKEIKDKHGIVPGLVTILVGENPASVSYVTLKIKTANRLGFYEIQDNQSPDISEADLLALIEKYNIKVG